MDTTFPGTRLEPFSVHARILPFSGTRTDSTLLQYWPEFYPSSILAGILPFSGAGRILPFSGTRLDTTFPGTRPYSTLLRYWFEFYRSPVLAIILPLLVLAQTLF